MKASGCIIAQNEEHCIEQAILSLRQFTLIDEIIVVDGGSVDNTVSICEQLGCRVVTKLWEQDFSLQRNFAMSLCRNDWIVFIDADEVLPEKTVSELSNLLLTLPDNYAAVRILEITELINDGADTTPIEPLNLDHYYPGYSQLENKHEAVVPWVHADNKSIFLSYSFRVLNKTKGKWVNKIHETFILDAGYELYVLPYEYVIRHQKHITDQYSSNTKYFQIEQPNKFLWEINYNDFVDNTSQKSITTLDEVFYKLVTEVMPCNYFIEAGAWQGETSRMVKSAVPSADVYAFEANPYNYDQFKHMFENSGANYINLAVSDRNDAITFRVQKRYMGEELDPVRGNNSILIRTEAGMEYEEVIVQSITLDSYFDGKIKSGDSVAMWVDLEGAAYQALEGAIKLLPNVDVIKVEVEQHQYWENQKLDTDIKNLLAQYGFWPVMRDYEYPLQYNILFCKQPIVDNKKFQSLINKYKFMVESNMSVVSYQERMEAIRQLYRTILQREADEQGLEAYTDGGMEIDEIAHSLRTSDEYKNLKST
jgi:FkbM family methyltransferase